MNPALTPKQIRALPLLVAGMSGVDTAKTIGVKASTVSEWLNHCPSFVAELDRHRNQAVQLALGQMQGAMTIAVSEVCKIMTKSKADSVRLKAASFIIESVVGPPKNSKAFLRDANDKEELATISSALMDIGIGNAAQ